MVIGKRVKQHLLKQLFWLGKITTLCLVSILPALFLFTTLEIKQEQEKDNLLNEIYKIKQDIKGLQNQISTPSSTIASTSSTNNPFSLLIDKLLKERSCYQTAIANIKMEDVNRLNQLTQEQTQPNCDPKSPTCLQQKIDAIQKNSKEISTLKQKTDRTGFEDRIESINEMLNSLYQGQHPSKGIPSSINFCNSDIYKSIVAK